MLKWITAVISSAGYAGIVALMFIENVFPPIPSEFIIPLAGFMVSQGQLAFAGVVLAGTLGSALGALPLYYIGRKIKEERIRRWTARHGRWMGMSTEDLDRAQNWFEKYGGWTVFFGRLVPGVRSLISIPAGVSKMNLLPFLLWSTAGMALWTTVLTAAGFLLKSSFGEVENYLEPVVYVVFGVLVAGYVYRVFKKRAAPEEL
ncbi:MAG TPA: DedA family protein [Pyrinomonadaceae bacterium]|jgi:membrane protein DedA with SNARE-associated domain